MLTYAALAPLKLRSFLPSEVPIVERSGWEWMNGVWHYEGIGFTWFGQLENDPMVTSGLELLFEELPADSLQRLLRCLDLPIQPGIDRSALECALGSVYATELYTTDRATYIFRLGTAEAYEVACTVHERQGLIRTSVVRNDVRRRLAVA